MNLEAPMAKQNTTLVQQKDHHGFMHFVFSGELHCPFCDRLAFRQAYWSYSGADWDEKIKPCPHVIYIWEENVGGSRFWKVRPDYGSEYIQDITKSPKYIEKLQLPQTYPLKLNEIGPFATGTFSCDGLIGSRVGEFGWNIPSISHPKVLPSGTVVYETSFYPKKVFVGLPAESRSISIAICAEDYHSVGMSEIQ
jgi:hypothetical protein